MIACAVYRLFHGSCDTSSKVETIELSLSQNINELKEEWSSLSITNKYFQVPYLSVIEQYGSDGIDNYYVIMKRGGKPVAAFLFQLTDFDFRQRMKKSLEENNSIHRLLNQKMKYKLLVHGNLYLSGNHMNFFEDTTLSEDDRTEYILDITDELSSYIEEEGTKVEAILIKDKDLGEKKSILLQKDGDFSSFCVDPNMILDISPKWKTIDDYLEAFKSKYRVRYRKARSVIKNLEKRNLSVEDIEKLEPKIYELYKKTATEAGFNIGLLDKEYFYKLKLSLGASLDVFGYFENNQLIGFYTSVKNSLIYSAHFLGFEKSYNSSHKLYLNILFDIVEQGIIGQYQSIYFSRTALEIKSTVGAVAHDLHCYIKLESRVKNKLLPFVLNKIVPTQDWKQRSPFKEIKE